METIKVKFHIVNQEFSNSEWTTLNVKVNMKGASTAEGELISDPEYSVILPDHMFTALADSEPRFSTKQDMTSFHTSIFGLHRRGSLTHKFQKTQTHVLISALQSYVYELTKILIDKHGPETSSMKKKIFIRFNHNVRHTTNNWTHAYRGEAINQTFNYFLGYEMMTTKFHTGLSDGMPKKKYITKILYASPNSSLNRHDTGFQEKSDVFEPLTSHGQTTEAFEREFLVIDHTPEREEFCKGVAQTFKDVNAKLSDFLLNLDALKMDTLIETTGFKLLDV